MLAKYKNTKIIMKINSACNGMVTTAKHVCQGHINQAKQVYAQFRILIVCLLMRINSNVLSVEGVGNPKETVAQENTEVILCELICQYT